VEVGGQVVIFDRIRFVLVFSVLLLLADKAHAALTAALEGPEDKQTVAGVAVIRGWAFSDTAGVTISKVDLLVDNNAITTIPCCSVRGDVAASFPGSPQALNSGFGITVNYNLLPLGPHSVRIQITDSSGAQKELSSTITVARAGNSQFLDQVDLNGATAQRDGQEIVLTGVRVRDKASQQISQITARLRWFANTQGLGLVGVSTVGPANLFVSSTPQREARRQTGAECPALQAALESPTHGQSAAGIAVIRGWAFATAGRSIRRVQLFVDGNAGPAIPCCSPRGDIASAFPNEPNALNSGFGFTFNYGLLAAGVHTITVEIEDSAGAKQTLTRGVLVRRPGEFTFLQDLDFSTATVRIANGTLVVDRAVAKDKATGQTVQRILRYRFDLSAQGFNLVEDNSGEVAIQNFSCDLNGDTTNLAALVQAPGPDGISLSEAITAANNTTTPASTLMTFSQPGTLTSCVLPSITRGSLTIDGDISGDGTPDVSLAGTPILVSAGNTTIQGLKIIGPGVYGVRVSPVSTASNTSFSHVALLGNILDGFREIDDPTTDVFGAAILILGGPKGTNSNRLSHILVSGNLVSNSRTGINVGAGLPPSSQNAVDTTVIDNTITQTDFGIQFVSSAYSALEMGTGNIATGGIYENRVQNSFYGLTVRGSGVKDTAEVVIANNLVESSDSGIQVSGSVGTASGSVVMTTVQGNGVQNTGAGMLLSASGGGRQSTLDMEVLNNELSSTRIPIAVTAGVGQAFGEGGTLISEVEDVLMARIQGNSTIRSIFPLLPEIQVYGGYGSSGNTVDTMIADNVSDKREELLRIVGGQSDCGGSCTESKNNTVTGTVIRNGAQQGSGSGMACPAVQRAIQQEGLGPALSVIGGTNATNGPVTNNLVKQTIIDIPVDTVRCEDGLPGNRAECTFEKSIEARSTIEPLDQISGEKGSSFTLTGAPRGQQLQERPAFITERLAELRSRAAKITDNRLQQRFVKLRERLEALRDKLGEGTSRKAASVQGQ
jgi:hypothetical protein